MKNPDNKSILMSLILIIIFGFTAYGNSLKGEFLWDDEFLVENNVYIKSWSNIPKIFTKDIGAGAGKKYYFYRPTQMFTYMIDYAFWKSNVVGYHLSNIILHILVALGIFWLVTILFKDWLLALFTSLLFTVHPVHTEAVSYISGRADSLALLFMLLCLIFYIKTLHSKNIGLYILMISSYILAILSKENSLILPALILLYHYAFKKRLKIKEFLPLLSIALAYILLRLTVLRHLLILECPTTILQRMPGFFLAITNYIKLLILPFNLHMEYGNKLFSITEPMAILGLLILFSSIVYASRRRKADILIFFSVSWFFLTLLPISNLYPINAYMAEHWLYMPSIGFFLIVAKFFSYLYRAKNLRIFIILFVIALLGFYSHLTIRQNTYWREALVFYERALKYTPGSSTIYNNLGSVYKNMGKIEKALASYKKAIEINPYNPEAYNDLGLLYHNIGKTKEAVALIKKAIKIYPFNAKAYYNLGVVYYSIGKIEEAIVSYKKAIEIYPEYAKAHDNLAVFYYYEKYYDLAIKHFDRAVEFGYRVDNKFLETLKPYRK